MRLERRERLERDGAHAATAGGRSAAGRWPRSAGCSTRARTGPGLAAVAHWRERHAALAVTLVRGVPLGAAALAVLGKQLRSACGAGGTVKDGAIEVQGEHVDRVIELLRQRGYTVKRAGG